MTSAFGDPEDRRPPRRMSLRAARRELLLMGGLALVYFGVRALGGDDVGDAIRNAREVHHVERWLPLPSEQTLQALALPFPHLVQAANAFYAVMHFPVTVGVLVWLFWRRPHYYAWARSSIVLATAAALILFVTFPVAPPRLVPGLDVIDTGVVYGQSVYGPLQPGSLANQLAALPSLHVGWALLVAIVMVAACRTRWRWLWVAHPAVTLAVVVVTGNHYWLDGLAGIALVVGALVAVPRPTGSVPRALPAAGG